MFCEPNLYQLTSNIYLAPLTHSVYGSKITTAYEVINLSAPCWVSDLEEAGLSQGNMALGPCLLGVVTVVSPTWLETNPSGQ